MTITVDGTNGVTTPSVSLQNIQESATVYTIAGAASTITYNIGTQSVLYYTQPATANFQFNFTPFNSLVSSGEAVTAVFLNTNGSTAYYCNGVSIEGVSQTVKWQTATPTAGNANSIDVYSFSIIRSSSLASGYLVLGTISKFA